MSKRSRRPASQRRPLTADEHQLWNHVKRSAAPLGDDGPKSMAALLGEQEGDGVGPHAAAVSPSLDEAMKRAGRQGAVASAPGAGSGLPAKGSAASDRAAPRKGGAKPSNTPSTKPSRPLTSTAAMNASSSTAPSGRVTLPTPASPTPADAFDRKAKRRIAKGMTDIDARIDLHGLRQDEAHDALRGFIARAVAAGHRTVLVITGKGASGRGEAAWSEAGDAFGREAPGVLRRKVPRWLRDDDLAHAVISFTAAHERHGGDGALYVQIRSAKKAAKAKR
ncbi:MAG: Smr/MutS family protein [Pseudomonadota bacterium]